MLGGIADTTRHRPLRPTPSPAAAFQLRTLEPDTIPLIALATRHRLASLINDAIAARDHRRFGSHLRPPPFTSKSKKRKRGLGAGDGDGNEDENEQDAEGEDEGDDGGGEDDDEDELFDFDFSTGQLVTEPKTGTGAAGRKRRKGKGTGGIGLDDDDAIEPAWDSVVFDDGEKLLGVLERVDREEERKKRRERMLRDQKEEEERALAEAIAASEAAEREAQGENGTGGGAGTAGNAAGNRASAGPSTPRPGAGGSGGGDETPVGLDKNGKPKKPSKKKKLDGTAPGSIKNMSEDVKKRLTDQTAMRSLGRKQFSWLNNGGGGGVGAGGFGSPSPALPRPKFAPASSLPPPTFATPNAHLSRTPGGGASNSDGLFSPLGSAGGGAAGAGGPGGPGGFGLGPGPSTLSRLSHVPPLHDANRAQRQLTEWETSRTVVERDDLLFVLERERGAGIGRGSGRNVVLRAQAGIIKR